MPSSCSAYGCTNRSSQKECIDRKITFHRFPLRNPNLLKEWLVKMKRLNFKPTLSSRICSDHFEEDCFTLQMCKNTKILKKDAVPTKFLFNKKPSRKRTNYKFGMEADPREGSSRDNLESAVTVEAVHKEVQTDMTFLTFVDEIYSARKEVEMLKEKMDKRFSPEYMSNDSLSSFTGFNKDTFFKVFNFLNIEENVEIKMMTPLKQYFMFLIRLKTGITLDVLSYIFEISTATAGRIFASVTGVMFLRFKELEPNLWPSRERINEMSPITISKYYPSCRAIIDCTEIQIQKPSNPKEQQTSFSTYKNANTQKALVCIGPSGCITYVSDLWSGSISDKQIFSKSKLPKLLEKGDLVLADKGFKIKEELEKLGCQLVTPSYLKDKVQFSFEERMHNKKISHVRVHVERAISRIKIYKYFEGPVQYKTMHNVNEVFFIAAMLTIFQKPLITMDLHPDSL